MKEIQLTKGKVALVDDEDFKQVGDRKYYAIEAGNKCYAARTIRVEGKTKRVYLHRELLNPGAGFTVDHINGNGLDNRRSNLRIASHKENSRNQCKQATQTTSQYKGVYWNKSRGYWIAQMCWRVGAKLCAKYLGHFSSEVDAAKAYNEAAKKHFGAFARLNNI